MIGAGFTTTDPVSGTHTTVLKGDRETKGMGWELEVRCPSSSQAHILEHIHTTWTETFEITSGSANYKLNGEVLSASAGDIIVMPPNQPHVHPWNIGRTEMVYRQINQFEKPSPHAAQDVLGVFATLNGLSREGKLDQRGLPKNILQFAASLRTLVKHGGYDAQVPIPVQDFIAGTLGRLAEALGYRSSYPKYLVSDSKV